jgi:hypothetical protein
LDGHWPQPQDPCGRFEAKVAQLMQKTTNLEARKRSPKIDYKDEFELLAYFVMGLDVLERDLKSKQDIVDNNKAVNRPNDNTLTESLESLKKEKKELDKRFAHLKYCAIRSAKLEFETGIITRIYGKPPPSVENTAPVLTQDESYEEEEEEEKEKTKKKRKRSSKDDYVDDEEESEEESEEEEAEDDDDDDDDDEDCEEDEHGTYAIGVNDGYRWTKASETKAWKDKRLLRSEFTVTIEGVPSITFSPQKLLSLIVRNDVKELPTKLFAIVGVNEFYEEVVSAIAMGVPFLSRVDTAAFLVTTRDTRSKNVDRDDVKK